MRRAFTLVELLASIAIIAILVTLSVVFIGNYVTWAKNTSDQRTLLILNDAITRYKCEGGVVGALTVGTPTGDLIAALQNPVTWNGVTHQFLKAPFTIPTGVTLAAKGNGPTYQLTQFGTYTGQAGGTTVPKVSPYPYGMGVGYLARAGTNAQSIGVQTSTGHVAYQINGGNSAYVNGSPGTWIYFSVPQNSSVTFYSCIANGDDTKSGSVIRFYCPNANVTSLNVSGLTSLLVILCPGNSALTSLNVSGLTNLSYIDCISDGLTSLDVSGCASYINYILYYGNPFATNATALNAFYNTLPTTSSGILDENSERGTNGVGSYGIATGKGWNFDMSFYD